METRANEQELQRRVAELEREVRRLRRERDEQDRMQFPWVGNLGRWEFRLDRNEVFFNEAKITALGYAADYVEQPVPYQFFTEKLHSEDYEHTMQKMRDHLEGRAPAYEVEYRIGTVDGGWKWYYDRGVVTEWAADGAPLLVAGIVFDITEQKEMEAQLRQQNQQLKEMAATDALTRVANRKVLLNQLAAEMKRWKRSAKDLCILMLDIDHFKNINDSYGHVTGDSVLRQTAQLIQDNLREVDLVGRYGGEEFMVLLPETSLGDAVIAAERVRRAVAAAEFSAGITVTISGGLATYRGERLEEFVDAADQCLYQAKNNGRDCIRSPLDASKTGEPQ